MRLLLTSGGVTNASIRSALIELLAKPIEESDALVIPTAQWAHPMCSPQSAWRTVAGAGSDSDLVRLGWRSVGVLELTALESIDAQRWIAWVRDADALLVDGGEAMYLVHWLRRSGLAALLPDLDETVWVGVSAGSMALTPRVGGQFVSWRPENGDEALGVVEFSIFPHLDFPGWESNTRDRARQWAEGIPGPSYGLDDDSAIVVANGRVEVVSEGHWEEFAPGEEK